MTTVEIISCVSGGIGLLGGLGALITSISSAKTAKSNLTKTVEEVYGGIVRSLREEANMLGEKVRQLTAKVEELEGRRCNNLGCKNRIPPKE